MVRTGLILVAMDVGLGALVWALVVVSLPEADFLVDVDVFLGDAIKTCCYGARRPPAKSVN